MRFVRRASLVFSLVLIVAIVVGYAVRTAELAGDRDAALTSAAELGGSALTTMVRAADVAAAAGGDRAASAEAVALVEPAVGVCAIDAVGHDCAGSGPKPDLAALDAAVDRRRDAAADAIDTTVTVYDNLMSIEARGPQHTIVVTAPADIVDVEGPSLVKVATFLPSGASVGGFADAQGFRQTSTQVTAAPDVFLVATTVADVDLPPDEYRFYVIIFALALVLLVLAGITLVVEQRSLVERASFDSLTRLPNRGEFERRAADAIAHAERQDSGAALLVFDLNGFKQVNDTYGHLVGDEMLKVVGSRLRKAVRDDDVVARWGGDEFVVLMPGVATEEMGARRALQLAEQIAGRTRLDGIDEALRVKVSVGVAVLPDHGRTLDDLVLAADQAMYEAKREGTVCRIAAARPAEFTHR